MNRGMPPRGGMGDQYNRVAPPKGIKDLPRFLRELLTGFLSRLLDTFRMVWETGHWILFAMIAIAILTGIMPLIGSLISSEILNALQDVIEGKGTAVFLGSMVMSLLVFYFVYKIINSVIGRLNTAVTRIAGEKVVRYVKLQIMEKAKEVDFSAFDQP